MAPEWDESKNNSNISKHGINFADAVAIFDGLTIEKEDERFDYGEQREQAMANEKRTAKRSPSSTGPVRTDWDRVNALADEEIERAAAEDPNAAPILDEEWFRTAEIVVPDKVPISIRLDRDVVDFFKSKGGRYQTRMNAVLRAYMEHERKRRA